MATIQIRDVPGSVHRTYRRRAARAGMSLQEYLKAELVRGAATTTPAEIAAEVEEHLTRHGGEGFMTASSAQLIRVDRQSH